MMLSDDEKEGVRSKQKDIRSLQYLATNTEASVEVAKMYELSNSDKEKVLFNNFGVDYSSELECPVCLVQIDQN